MKPPGEPELEEKFCVGCAEKTPHEFSTIPVLVQSVIFIVLFGIITAVTGIGGLIPAAIVGVSLYYGLAKIRFYKCYLCGAKYDADKANKIVRERNRVIRKAKWDREKGQS